MHDALRVTTPYKSRWCAVDQLTAGGGVGALPRQGDGARGAAGAVRAKQGPTLIGSIEGGMAQ